LSINGGRKARDKTGFYNAKTHFYAEKADLVSSYIFLQALHNDASSTLNIDPIYCTVAPFFTTM